MAARHRASTTSWRRRMWWSLPTVLVLAVALGALGTAAIRLAREADGIETAQRRLARQLVTGQWGSATSGDGVRPGTPLYWLELPTLQRGWVVVEGTGDRQLAEGPGHSGAAPGATGNVVIAGHRDPALFWHLDELAPGDPIVIEAGTGRVTYRVLSKRVVPVSAADQMAPNPDRPDLPPTRSLITLITCDPKLFNTNRLIVRGELTGG
jgi:LPXTG-site transpeptidase (sortase) family protein